MNPNDTPVSSPVQTTPPIKWYKRTWFIVLSLIIFPPLGIFLTWKYAGWSKNAKIAAIIASAVFFIYTLNVSANAAPVLTIDNAPNNRATTEEASYRVSGTIEGANSSTTITVNSKPAQVNDTRYSAVLELKEGDNTVIISAKKNDKTVSETMIVHRLTTDEMNAKKAVATSTLSVTAKPQQTTSTPSITAKPSTPTPAKTTPAPATPTITLSQKNAVNKAKDYLNYTAFSHDGLVAQLEYEKFSAADATYGADNCGADWNQQAAKKAKDYLNYTSFSRDGLIEQLEYDKFTPDQATYGVNAVGL